MPFTIAAQVNGTLPGSVLLSVAGDAGVPSSIVRAEGALDVHPVRNYSTTGTGIDSVIDCEAPLGRPVTYRLLDAAGAVLATSGTVVCPEDPLGRSILRSVLKPQVQWMWVEPAAEEDVTWRSSTRSYEIVGSDTPVIVGEVRQRHSGRLSFLCKSVEEADRLVEILRDGLPMLVRHSPCAALQTRDTLFYALDVQEDRLTRQGWRVIEVEYQSTKFVPGDTIEPPASWTFGALAAAHTDFAALSAAYDTFLDVALDRPKGAQ